VWLTVLVESQRVKGERIAGRVDLNIILIDTFIVNTGLVLFFFSFLYFLVFWQKKRN